jgi:PAS domain S-box-containing protein
VLKPMPSAGNGSLVTVPRQSADAAGRLALVESLIESDDLEACAQKAVEWLVKELGAEQAACITLDAEGKRLVGIAGEGMPYSKVADFSIDLEDRSHRLMVALNKEEPVHFGASRVQPDTPLEGTPFHAIPLRGHGERGAMAVGLLLVSAPTRSVSPDTLWLSQVLGSKLVRLHAGEALAERRLGREKNLLYSLINAVTDPILLTDTEGKLIIANSRAEKLFGSSDDDSEGRRRAVGINNMLFSSALTTRAIEQGVTTPREILLVDPLDGSDLLFELLTTTVRDPREGTRVVSILRNVTDLRKAMVEIEENYQKLRLAEAEVRAERHRLDLIIDSVADPIVVTDPGGDIVLMNAPAERLFMVRKAQGRPTLHRVRSNDAQFSSFVSSLLASGTDRRWQGEISLQDPETDSPMPVEAVAGKILSEQGELTAVVTILHDRREAIEKARLYEQLKKGSDELQLKVQEATAELAKQNELLRRQALELEQASNLKTQFLANMSHEFRTPLNAILGYTNMLLQGISGELQASQKRSLQRVDSNSRHLLSIINEILDISRIEAGRMPLHITTFRMSDLLREVQLELEPIIVRSKLQVTARIDPDLPSLHSDRQKVKQIIVNLFSNALKFTHEGSIVIRVSCGRRKKIVSIAVEDTGIGIPQSDFEKVFEDFRQLDNSPSRGYGGTGLGLSISRRLAAMLHGRLKLASRLGVGSTFTLEIPSRLR